MDLIERQAALDAMCEACSDWCDEGVCKKMSAIQKLPSVQSKTDYALKEFGNCSYSETGCSDCKVKEKIRNALSAQPERTCVNCGRTVNNGGWYTDGRTRCPIEEHYALPKDGYCHLWEKRNVTDDDYPERRQE